MASAASTAVGDCNLPLVSQVRDELPIAPDTRTHPRDASRPCSGHRRGYIGGHSYQGT